MNSAASVYSTDPAVPMDYSGFEYNKTRNSYRATVTGTKSIVLKRVGLSKSDFGHCTALSSMPPDAADLMKRLYEDIFEMCDASKKLFRNTVLQCVHPLVHWWNKSNDAVVLDGTLPGCPPYGEDVPRDSPILADIIAGVSCATVMGGTGVIKLHCRLQQAVVYPGCPVFCNAEVHPLLAADSLHASGVVVLGPPTNLLKDVMADVLFPDTPVRPRKRAK